MALLSGARNNRNASLAEQVFNRMESLFPSNKLLQTSARILLANTMASSRDFFRSHQLRKKILETGGKKTAGLSWTVIDGKIEVRNDEEKNLKLKCPSSHSSRNFMHMIEVILDFLKLKWN